MDLLEYQGKQLLSAHGVVVPRGGVADTVEGVVALADDLGYPVVVKAQVQVGGRGKAGGIQMAASAEGVRTSTRSMLHRPLKGHVVRRVWVEE
ncbi:MAG: acetate--CoA ligase family protein, partial [Actinomycetota bacterium]|nr:acetate--CoA ligase family protein [Actinomycetota bacterium]